MAMHEHAVTDHPPKGLYTRPTVHISGTSAGLSTRYSPPTKSIDEVGANSPLSSLRSQQHTTVFHAQKISIQPHTFALIDSKATAKGELVCARAPLAIPLDA